MAAIGNRTVVDYIPAHLSQASADWYVDEKTCISCLKYSVCLISNIGAIAITPIAMLCDLIASLVIKLWAFSTSNEELHTKSWEYLKSGSLGGFLVILLAGLRIFSPGYSSQIIEVVEEPDAQPEEMPPPNHPAAPATPTSNRGPAPLTRLAGTPNHSNIAALPIVSPYALRIENP